MVYKRKGKHTHFISARMGETLIWNPSPDPFPSSVSLSIPPRLSPSIIHPSKDLSLHLYICQAIYVSIDYSINLSSLINKETKSF